MVCAEAYDFNLCVCVFRERCGVITFRQNQNELSQKHRQHDSVGQYAGNGSRRFSRKRYIDLGKMEGEMESILMSNEFEMNSFLNNIHLIRDTRIPARSCSYLISQSKFINHADAGEEFQLHIKHENAGNNVVSVTLTVAWFLVSDVCNKLRHVIKIRYIILSYTILNWAKLRYTILHYTMLYYIILYYTGLN